MPVPAKLQFYLRGKSIDQIRAQLLDDPSFLDTGDLRRLAWQYVNETFADREGYRLELERAQQKKARVHFWSSVALLALFTAILVSFIVLLGGQPVAPG